MGTHSIRNPEAVRDALRSVCERGELLILVTPAMWYNLRQFGQQTEAF